MKKLLYSAAALSLAFFAASCQQENLEPVGTGSNTVTYSVQVPDAIATKANPGSVAGVTELVYEVYRLDANGENIVSLAYEDVVTLENGETKWDLELEFVKDQKFQVLFWAQKPNVGAYNTGDLRQVSLNSATLTANVDDYAAFAGYDYVTNCVSHKEGKVTLVRPISQIQVGTDAEELVLGTSTEQIRLTSSSMLVKGLPTTYNVANGEVSALEEQDVEYTVNAVPDDTFTANSKVYKYVAQNYVAFADAMGTTVEVDFTVTTSEGDIQHTVSNVPLKPNYRTNIIGNLITENADYSIDLEANWADADKSMEVIVDGLVKNINGDYEVTEEKGLAYAINNLFKLGGDFYLTKALYDLTGYAVNPPAVPAGKELNIYGETPVVTRAASTLAGITIIGLPEVEGTPTLIAKVEEGGSVSVSGVTLDDERSVLVKNNEGTLVISETTADKIVSNGNDPVAADKIEDFASLKAAVESGIKVIEIAADIEATEVVLIGRSVTINGNGKTFTTSANRAFRLTTIGIEVIFNDLKIVSKAVREGYNDIRGVSIDNVDNITLTLNNSSHDFTDTSANDWAYAVNVVGGTNHKVTINGGKYKGANVVNVRGANHTITIDGAVLTSLYQPSSAYYGFCVSLQDAENSIATIKNSTLNSVHAKAFGGTTKNEFVLENNEDNTQVYPFFIGNAPYLTLNEAFAAAENNTTIYAPFNAEISSSTVPAGKKVTLVLQNQATKYNTQLTGTDESTGSFALINVNQGADLTITGPGSIKLSATENRGWNAYSSVVSNQRGTLTVNGGAVIEHLGGTDMAYGIDNLTNGKGTQATTTIDGATVASTYRAIRQFLNGTEATNDLYVNAGSIIKGANKSIWMQDPSANANTGKLVVEEGAKLYGDVYLFVCAGSESWPVSVSIPASTLMDGSEVMTGNLPEGYSVEEKNGVYEVTYKSPAQARLEALINEGGEVVLTENIELSSPIEIKNVTVTLDLNGKTITAGKDGYAIENKGELTIKNNGVINGVVYAEGTSAKTTINGGTYNALTNWVFLNSQGASLTINDATINGGSSYPIYSYDANSKLVINDATVNATFGCINAYGTNGTVEINGGTFQMTGVQGKTSHIAYFSNVDAVINGGTFEKVGDINMSGTGGGGICAIYGAALKITNGTFAGDYADLYDWGGKNGNDRGVAISVEGGTYKFKPTSLPEGFAATQNADGTWTVAKN